MIIDIIHPAHYNAAGELCQAKKWYNRLGVYLPHLGPALLAGLTPSEHEVRIVEEYLEDINYDTGAGVIAISAQIMQFQRAVDISLEFKKRGKTTILGGYLPTLVPEKVEPFFDSIVIGEADKIWEGILQDIKNQRLKKRYVGPAVRDLSALPVPRYDLIKKDRIVVYPVQATRGCPFQCNYCSIASLYKGDYRKRPVKDVLRDIEATGSKNINFCDDNLCEDFTYSEQLFEAITPLKIRWGTQTTIKVTGNAKLLEKARRSGCNMMALGVETLESQNLSEMQKTFQKIDKYAQAFKNLLEAGISPHALIIFGLPQDNKEIFHRTVDYLENLKIPIAQFFLFVPYPGTPVGEKMLKKGLVTDSDLSHYREPYVVYRPDNLSPEDLIAGWRDSLSRFYSLSSILKRVVLNRKCSNYWLNFMTNMFYYWQVKRNIHPVYFGM